MHEGFDPHLAWLGISPAEQPADYYRLLGVAQFEPDRDVIRKASEERMALLKAHKTGSQARLAQKVASQISKATSCLLNPYRRSLYDSYLRSHHDDPSQPGVVWPPMDAKFPGETDELPAVESEPRTTLGVLRQHARRLVTTRPALMAVSVLLVAGLLGGGVLSLFWRPSNPRITATSSVVPSKDGGKIAAGVKPEALQARNETPIDSPVAHPQPQIEVATAPDPQSPAAPLESVSVSGGLASNTGQAPASQTLVPPGTNEPPQPAVDTAAVVTRSDSGSAASIPTLEASNAKRVETLPSSPVARKKPPAAEDQETARRKVRAILAEEFAAAKRPADHVELCDKLVGLARDSKDDSAAQYALYSEACEQAILGTDYAKALAVTEQLASTFDVDIWQQKAGTLARAGETARLSADRKQLALTAQALIPSLLRAGQFDLASEVAQVAISAATRARDPELGKAVRQIRDEISQIKRKWVEAEQVAEQLQGDPDNAELNQRYGEFLCFERGDWQKGVPHLVRSANVVVRRAAEKDAAAPDQVERQAEVADAWFEAAEVVERDFQPAAYARVLFWARQALPRASGLTKVRLEGRIQDSERKLADGAKETSSNTLAASESRRSASPPPAWRPPEGFQGLLGRLQLEGRDVGVLWKYASGLQLTDTAVSQLLQQAGLARGRVRMEFVGLLFMTAPTTVNIVQNGGMREGGQAALAVDGQVLGEVGGAKATRGIYKVELTPGEHRVQWVLAGGNLGVCVVQFQDAISGAPLPVYHSPALLVAIRDTPFRARINVNMIQN